MSMYKQTAQSTDDTPYSINTNHDFIHMAYMMQIILKNKFDMTWCVWEVVGWIYGTTTYFHELVTPILAAEHRTAPFGE